MRQPPPHVHRPGVAGTRFTWTFVILCCWLMAGAYLDAWHHHNLTRPETSPFTPYHFLLYAAEAAIGVFLGINVARNFLRYRTWGELLPDGYGISLLGSVLFGIGGVLDLLWHLRFGIEFSVAALFSPTHLLLMGSGGLIVSGPLRAEVRRGGEVASWAAVVSAALTLSMFTFFAQFDQPFMQRWAAGTAPLPGSPIYMQEELGMLGLILYASMVSALLVLCLRRFTLRVGSVTVILVINGILTSNVEKHPEMIVVSIIGGIVGDALLYILRPSPSRRNAFRLFAFCVPAALTAIYVGFLAATTGVWWEPSIWAGAAPVAGVAGWMLAFVALPGEGATERITRASDASIHVNDAPSSALTISTPADDAPATST
jgi:hypothetical protein